MAATIKLLLARGDLVVIEHGRLVITPMSGKPVPDNWLANYLPAFMCEIALTTGINIFQYERYSVGKFGRQNFEGILLHYTNIATGKTAQIFYNCEITRARTTKAGKQGEPLPFGQFRVGKNHAFTKHWLSLGLPLPRLSEFHYCMGKLKTVYLTGSQNEKGKLDKSTSKPMNINANELKKAFPVSNALPDNYPIKPRQLPDNDPIRTPDKKTAQNQAQQGFQAVSSTDKSSTLLSNQVSACKAMPLDNLSVGNTPNTVTMNYKDIPAWNPKP